MREVALESDINIDVNGPIWVEVKNPEHPFTAMLISHSRGTCLIAVLPQTIILYKVIAYKSTLKYIWSNILLTFNGKFHRHMSISCCHFKIYRVEQWSEIPLYPYLVKKILNLFCVRKENTAFGPHLRLNSTRIGYYKV